MDLLVIDDEQEICALLAAMLVRHGAQVSMAHSLAEARQAIARHRFDLVLLDINLPDGSGHELIPHIRDACPQVRIVAISAMEGEGPLARRNGADLFIPKPFDRKAILAGLQSLLGSRWTS